MEMVLCPENWVGNLVAQLHDECSSFLKYCKSTSVLELFDSKVMYEKQSVGYEWSELLVDCVLNTQPVGYCQAQIKL